MIRQFAYQGEVSDQVVKLEFAFYATDICVTNDGAADLYVCFTGDDHSRCVDCDYLGLLANGFCITSHERREFKLSPGTGTICLKAMAGHKTDARVEAYHF